MSATPTNTNRAQSYSASLPQYHQQSASPAPINQSHQYTPQGSTSYGRPHHASTSSSHLDHYSTPQSRYQPQVHQRIPDANVVAQRPQEVFHLPENANQAIPEHVRHQFQQDANGHILFFTTPPVDTMPPVKPKSALQHSARYMADKIRARRDVREKRIAEGLPAEEDEQPTTKKAKQSDDGNLQERTDDVIVKALSVWNDQMQASTDRIYQSLYGEHWEEGKRYELEKLARLQADHQKKRAVLARKQKERKSSLRMSKGSITDNGIYKDDYDPRY